MRERGGIHGRLRENGDAIVRVPGALQGSAPSPLAQPVGGLRSGGRGETG